jgi:hypothetical protein
MFLEKINNKTDGMDMACTAPAGRHYFQYGRRP